MDNCKGAYISEDLRFGWGGGVGVLGGTVLIYFRCFADLPVALQQGQPQIVRNLRANTPLMTND